METFVTNYNPHCCRHCGNQMLSVIDCKLEDAEVRLKRLETWKDTVPELYLSIVDAEDKYLSKVDAEDIYLHTDDELYKLYIDTITRAMGGSSIEPITINGKTVNTRDLLDANKDGVIGMGDIGSATLLRNYAYGAIIDYLMKHYGNSYYTQSQVDSAITEEARLRLLADEDLQDSINQLHNDLTAETQNRVAGDTNALSNANHYTDDQIASLRSSMNSEDVRLGGRIDSVNTDLQGAKNTSEAHYTELREWLSTIDSDYDHFEEQVREAIARKADKVANATNGNFASLDENGNLVDSGHKHSDYQPAGNYKTKLTAKSSPSTSGNALEFIDTVSQDANGVITATKKKIQYVSDSADGIITKDQKLYWDAKQPAGNYKTVQSAKANPTATDLDLTNHTFTFVDSISQNANGEISATSKKINTSAWDDAANKRHTHTNKAELDKIQTDDVQKWNKTTDDLKAIIDTPDEDSVINKWNEIIHFLETYTEADTLANLLRNKADKDEVAPKYLPLIQNYVKNIRQDANNQNKLTIELHNTLTDSEFEYNPTWSDQYTGTVTSVAMTVPTGLAVSGSPITTAGTLAVSFANGYSIPTIAKQNNWDAAYGWGNHANAGYAHTSDIPSLTNYVTTDSALNITAAKTFTSGASSSEQNVRIKNDGITFDSTIRGVQTKAELYISADGRLSVKNNAGNIVGTVAYYDEIPSAAKQTNWDTAYGWGNHANAGYAFAQDLNNTVRIYNATVSGNTLTLTKHISETDPDTTIQYTPDLSAYALVSNVYSKDDVNGIINTINDKFSNYAKLDEFNTFTRPQTIKTTNTRASIAISDSNILKTNANGTTDNVAFMADLTTEAQLRQNAIDDLREEINNAGYATESYVDDAIDNLSPYYSESEIDQLFYNKSQINSMLNGYATTSVTDELQLSIDDLYSKIPGAITNYVTTDTAQNIIGTKTFLPQNTTTDKSKVVVDNTGITIRNAEPSLDPISHLTIYHDAKLTVNTNDRLLVNGNVVALLSEVPAAITNYVTTDTQQTITATKTFTGCRISIGNGGILDLNGNTMLIGTVSSTEGFADMATLSIQNGRPNIYTGGVGATLDGIRIATQNWVTSNFVSSSVLSDYVVANNPVVTDMVILNNANNNNGILFGGNMNNSYAAIVDDNTSMIFIHGSNNITLPNKSGTIALTSDLPTSADFVTPLQLSTTLLDYVHTNVNTENIYGTKIFSPYVPSGATTTDNSQATVKSSLIKLSSYINVSGGSKNVTEGQFISSELTIDKYTENSSGEQTGKVWHTAIDTNHIEFGWVDADTFDASFAGIYINDSSQLEIRGSLSAYNGIIATQNYVDNAIAEGNFISQNPSMISFPYTDTSEVGEPTHYVELTSGMYSSTGGGLYANNNRLAFASEVDALTQSMVDALDDLDARVTALENRN